MSVESPYCPACGCYTGPPDQTDTVCCNSYLHPYGAMRIGPRFKNRGRRAKRSGGRRTWQKGWRQ